MENSRQDLFFELRNFGVPNVLISSNVALRQDGEPRSDCRTPGDPGVAVYFKLKGRDCVLACDKWDRPEDNLGAIARHISAMRAQERYGVGSVEQAFAGYTALPAPGDSGTDWRTVFGIPEGSEVTFDEAQQRFRKLALVAHPDNGGSHARMVVLNNAWDAARRHFGQ